MRISSQRISQPVSACKVQDVASSTHIRVAPQANASSQVQRGRSTSPTHRAGAPDTVNLQDAPRCAVTTATIGCGLQGQPMIQQMSSVAPQSMRTTSAGLAASGPVMLAVEPVAAPLPRVPRMISAVSLGQPQFATGG